MIQGVPNIMRPSLTLKRYMLIWMNIAAVGFCLTMILHFGVINNLSNVYVTFKLEIFVQALEMVWVTTLLLACRPRKVWPAYFTLSIDGMRNWNPN